MKARKENKVYSIEEPQKQRYLETGFDIFSDDGKLLEHSPLKKIQYSEFAKLEEENEALKKEIAELKKKLELLEEDPFEDESDPEPEEKPAKKETKKAGK